jgi:hypothetical protein
MKAKQKVLVDSNNNDQNQDESREDDSDEANQTTDNLRSTATSTRKRRSIRSDSPAVQRKKSRLTTAGKPA